MNEPSQEDIKITICYERYVKFSLLVFTINTKYTWEFKINGEYVHIVFKESIII